MSVVPVSIREAESEGRSLRQRQRRSVVDSAPVERGEQPAPRFRFIGTSELLSRTAPSWLVSGLIPQRGLIVIWGASGSGKTFTALDLACSIARGLPWAGRRSRQCTVAYIAAEGNLQPRVAAYQKHHELAQLDGLRILDQSVSLIEDTPALVESLQALQADAGRVGLVVIDTLNRTMPGADENSGQDMGRVIAATKDIEAALDCAVLLIHHSGKDEARGSRGHSSLKAAVDTELSVKRSGDVRSLTIEKQRDGADGETVMTFELRSVDLGPMTDLDPDADPDERQRSCVVSEVERTASRSRRPEPKGSNQRIALRVLRDLTADDGQPLPTSSVIPPGVRGVPVSRLIERVADKMSGETAARKRERAGDALTGLIGGQFADRHGEWVWLC